MEEPAAVAETHSACVFLVGDRAYKLKKPVRLDFLDFTTRERREAAVHREVELNRRLAPDVYLGVADVVGPDGDVCDHLVVMRRMPATRRLSTLLRSGVPLDREIDEIARTVAAFHARAAASPEIAIAGRPEFVSDKLDRDLAELGVFADAIVSGAKLDEVGRLTRTYLAGREPLLEQRVAHGFIRDCHGDLLADDIFCLADGPRILDCIDFDDRLRHCDVLSDVAFLAMDLEHLGAATLAEQLMARYRELTNEHHPETLAHYYIASRALIRSKVACVRTSQGESSAAELATTLLELARQHLRRARVRMVLVGGTPGTGKSTLATRLGDRLGWVVLRSDEVRKDVAGLGHATHAEARLGEGIYDAATTNATYEALLDRARTALDLGEPVILDASWSRQHWRDQASRVARETASELVELQCDVPAETAVRRVEHRRAVSTDPSDATAAVVMSMRTTFDPWLSARLIETDASPRSVEDAVLAILDDE